MVLRVANPFGPRQRLDAAQGVVPVFLGKALRHEPLQIWGDGTTVRDFLGVADVVTALLAAAQYKGAESLFNIGSGQGLSLNQLIALLEQQLNRSLDVQYLPFRGCDVPTNVLCIDRANEALNWAPKIPVADGLRRLCDSLNG